MPFVITNHPTIFFFTKNTVWPPLPGVWKNGPPHYMAKNENHPRGLCDSLNEAFWCTDCNAKNLTSLRSLISVKMMKNRQKIPFFSKMPNFYGFSWSFQKWDFVESWGFLRCNQCIKTLHLSYQMTLSDDFHFSPYNGGVRFFRPLVDSLIQFRIYFECPESWCRQLLWRPRLASWCSLLTLPPPPNEV